MTRRTYQRSRAEGACACGRARADEFSMSTMRAPRCPSRHYHDVLHRVASPCCSGRGTRWTGAIRLATMTANNQGEEGASMTFRSLKCWILVGVPLAASPLMSVQSAPEPAAQAHAALLGYSGQATALERRLNARPHHVGSPYDKDNAEWILSKFKEWGFDAKIDTFDVLFPTPKDRILEMLKPSDFHARLQEP